MGWRVAAAIVALLPRAALRMLGALLGVIAFDVLRIRRAHVLASMERAGVEPAELESIAVGVGPGTFTGLRVGIATARALASASGLPLRPVSSLAALAAGIDAPMRLPLIDARRGELFAALHDPDGPVLEPFHSNPAHERQGLSRG